MALDSVFLRALAGELSGALTGAKIEKVQQPSRGAVVLTLKGERRFDLYLGSGAGVPRVHLSGMDFEKPQEPPMFCMLLRKHLAGARILSVEQPGWERVLTLKLAAPGVFGEGEERFLTVELLGRTANVILTDGEGIITDCLYRVGAVGERRMVLPGMRYRLPPAQEKVPFVGKSREELWERLRQENGTLDKALVRSFLGLSPLVARELCFEAYGETGPAPDTLPDGGQAVTEALLRLGEAVEAGDFAPYLLTAPNGTPFDFSYRPILQYGSGYTLTKLGSFSELLDAFCGHRDEEERRQTRSRELSKTVKNARDRVQRRLAAQREELRDTENREYYRECGDLVTSNLHRMRKGETVLVCQDYYDPEGGEREIKLDPLKTPQQNAARFYKEYSRKKSAQAHLTERLAAGEEELSYLESVLDELARAETAADLAEIRSELLEAGLLREAKSGKKEKRRSSAPMRFLSSTGFDIRVGRNNVQNDALTLKNSAKTDLWLHVQKLHGSHVVISTEGRVPDDETVQEAASLAAYYSEGRDSGKVPVDAALVKHVKKPSGARPGMVIYTDYRTVTARPNGELAQRLRVK